jgi:hypothetical protein
VWFLSLDEGGESGPGRGPFIHNPIALEDKQ